MLHYQHIRMSSRDNNQFATIYVLSHAHPSKTRDYEKIRAELATYIEKEIEYLPSDLNHGHAAFSLAVDELAIAQKQRQRLIVRVELMELMNKDFDRWLASL